MLPLGVLLPLAKFPRLSAAGVSCCGDCVCGSVSLLLVPVAEAVVVLGGHELECGRSRVMRLHEAGLSRSVPPYRPFAWISKAHQEAVAQGPAGLRKAAARTQSLHLVPCTRTGPSPARGL